MSTSDDIVQQACEYPKHQTYQDIHPFELSHYFDQFDALEDKLFHNSQRTSFDFWDYSFATRGFSGATITNILDLKNQLRLVGTEPARDPFCRFIFLEASLGRKLKITRNLLTLILSYQQVLPQFLDLLFLFTGNIDASDFRSIGLRYSTRLTNESRGPEMRDRGWSGRDIKVCYNLKSPECDETNALSVWPWNIEQSAIHHSFDVDTGQASWLVVEGGSLLKKRIHSATNQGAKPGLSFDSREHGFASALSTHLIFCEWSRQSWHSYIDFLNKEIQGMTKRAKSPLPETVTTLSSRLGASGLRQRLGTNISQSSSQVPMENTPTGPSPLPASQFSAQGAQQPLFSLSDLQDSYSMEEIVNNASLNLRVNQNILMELKSAYKSFEYATGWPADLSAECRGDLARFETRITSIQNDMIIQQSRVDTLSRLITDRRSLLTTILDDQNTSFNILQAELAQSSADKMELMTKNMEDLTKAMHAIAEQTREETVSMRIMALIALMFLPGTFTSTLMTTKIFQSSNSAEYEQARNQFLITSLPLLFGMILVWYVAKKWYKKVHRIEMGKKSE